MRLVFAGLLIVLCAASGQHAHTQTTSSRKASAPPDHSKAHAWAEAVTDFIADPRLLEAFPPGDVTKRFEALVPPASWKEEGDYPEGNIQKGIARLRYELGDEDDGRATVSWVFIYMPRTDPDGVDVLSRVIASMKKKLRSPWVGYQHYPSNGGYYWDQKKALLQVSIEPVDNIPDIDGKDRNGSWVWVNFAHVEGFGKP